VAHLRLLVLSLRNFNLDAVQVMIDWNGFRKIFRYKLINFGEYWGDLEILLEQSFVIWCLLIVGNSPGRLWFVNKGR